MLDFLWKIVSIWSLYETARFILIHCIREEIRRIANTRSTCPRCRWRLFCTRTALYLRSRIGVNSPTRQRAGIAVLLTGLICGNGDALWIVLRKLLEERKTINGKKIVPGLRNRRRVRFTVLWKVSTRFRQLFQHGQNPFRSGKSPEAEPRRGAEKERN